jgi:hypothetical protein
MFYGAWNTDDRFTAVYAFISGNSLVPQPKLYDLFNISMKVNIARLLLFGGWNFDRLKGGATCN